MIRPGSACAVCFFPSTIGDRREISEIATAKSAGHIEAESLLPMFAGVTASGYRAAHA
jgi:hypothetical protein